MASSGTIYGSFSGTSTANARPYISWSITQSGNSSTVTSSLYFVRYASWGSWNTSSHSNTSNIDGTTSYTASSPFDTRPAAGSYLIRTSTKTVTHNADGTRTCYLAWSGDTKVSLGTYSFGDTVTLDRIPKAPTVSTSAASSVDKFTATLNGNVTDGGGASLTQRGFCYNTTGNPTTADTKTYSGTATGAYSIGATSLSANTTYYAKAYAINSVGTGYGGQITFTTLKAAPTVTTAAATSILDTTATLGGNVTDEGGDTITERGVVYAVTTTPTTLDNKATTTGTTGAYTVGVTGLTASTTYYARAYAINSHGTAYGSQVSFKTEPTEPSSLAATATSRTTASLTWTKGAGTDTTVIRRSTAGYPADPTSGSAVYSGAGSSYSDTGLDMGTTTYYRAWSLEGADNYSTDTSDTTVLTHYGLTNATNAYEVDDTYATAPANDGKVYASISRNGGTTWSAEHEITLTGSNAEHTFGVGSEELWGMTLSGTDINDTNFRLKLVIGSNRTSYHTFKTYGFVISADYLLTGLEIKIKGYFDTDTTYVDGTLIKAYYGTSVLPIQAGTQAYDSTTNRMVYYNGTAWKQLANTDDA